MISASCLGNALSSSLSIGNDDNDNGHVEELKDSDGSSTHDVFSRLEKMLNSRVLSDQEEKEEQSSSSSLRIFQKHIAACSATCENCCSIVAHHKNWRARAAAVTFATRVLRKQQRLTTQ